MMNELNAIFDLYMEKIKEWKGDRFQEFERTFGLKKKYYRNGDEFGIFWGDGLRLDPPFCSLSTWVDGDGIQIIMVRWDTGSRRQRVICPLSEWSPMKYYR